MKQLVGIFFLLTATVTMAMAAKKNVTHFADIPVTGTAADVTSKLIKKGFELHDMTILAGEFNQMKVYASVLESEKGVYAIKLIDKEGVTDPMKAVEKYNTLIAWFKDHKNYKEYESNSFVYTSDKQKIDQYIQENWYLAEFFQNVDDTKGDSYENYKKPVTFYLTIIGGTYHLVICFENRENRPENIKEDSIL